MKNVCGIEKLLLHPMIKRGFYSGICKPQAILIPLEHSNI